MTRAHTHRAVSSAALTQSGKFTQAFPANAYEARSLLTAPFVYSLLVPFAVLDLWVTAFQWICFPLYGVPCVRRRDYLIVDRQKLPYLTGLEKVNCVFCGYANGLIAYIREVGARTEQYWCPIRHERDLPSPHERYRLFFAYGDARAYHQGLMPLRRRLQREGGRRHQSAARLADPRAPRWPPAGRRWSPTVEAAAWPPRPGTHRHRPW